MSKLRASPRYRFSVYIAGETRMAHLAVNRLRKICEENVPGNYNIQVIDIAKRPDLARNQNILATPSVFRTLPAPLRKSIGDLSDKNKAILGLDLAIPPPPSPHNKSSPSRETQ
jgi:circadian clock protein KaiB